MADGQSADLHLLAWLSPAFPVGAFAYSHGLETAVDLGDVSDRETLAAWIADLMRHGSALNDAILTAAAWRGASGHCAEALQQANELALALCSSRERRLETASMGNAFASTIRAAWPDAACPLLPAGDIAYPVAFGAACGTQRIGLEGCLRAVILAFAQNLVSAAVRLGPIGQTDGQRVTAALIDDTHRLAEFAARSSLDDVGGCAQRSEIAAMRHETLYSRLFRS